mmetsp:Transcript_30222/g.89752  ORF Transcript_30222/g.89752 Transcript_30222/m.89752 type:complete len:233 (+) Transcript_30222:304-1002(+)
MLEVVGNGLGVGVARGADPLQRLDRADLRLRRHLLVLEPVGDLGDVGVRLPAAGMRELADRKRRVPPHLPVIVEGGPHKRLVSDPRGSPAVHLHPPPAIHDLPQPLDGLAPHLDVGIRQLLCLDLLVVALLRRLVVPVHVAPVQLRGPGRERAARRTVLPQRVGPLLLPPHGDAASDQGSGAEGAGGPDGDEREQRHERTPSRGGPASAAPARHIAGGRHGADRRLLRQGGC